MTGRHPLLAIYSEYGQVTTACKKGTLLQSKVNKKDTFSLKMIYTRVRGWTMEYPFPEYLVF